MPASAKWGPCDAQSHSLHKKYAKQSAMHSRDKEWTQYKAWTRKGQQTMNF